MLNISIVDCCQKSTNQRIFSWFSFSFPVKCPMISIYPAVTVPLLTTETRSVDVWMDLLMFFQTVMRMRTNHNHAGLACSTGAAGRCNLPLTVLEAQTRAGRYGKILISHFFLKTFRFYGIWVFFLFVCLFVFSWWRGTSARRLKTSTVWHRNIKKKMS